MTTRAELRQLISEHELDAYADDILATAQPAIRIERTRVDNDALIPIGASKLGGSPDVPADFVWPEWNETPLTFLAQFRLSDLAELDVENALPHSGLLSFFYAVNSQFDSTSVKDHSFFKVLHFENEAQSLNRFPHPVQPARLIDIEAYRACVVTFLPQLTLPDLHTIERPVISVDPVDFPAEFDLTDDEQSRFGRLAWKISGSEPRYRLLGFPDTLQGEMRSECEAYNSEETWTWRDVEEPEKRQQIEARIAEWRLLLQFDTDDGKDGLGENWCLSGTLYFWIRKQDLAARDFDKSWFIVQCT